MEILIVIGFVIAVLVIADRVMLLLERHGHVNWRRTGRKRIPAEGRVELDQLLDEPARDSR